MTPEQFAEAERLIEEEAAHYRAHTSPVVEEWRSVLPRLRTSGLLIYLNDSGECEFFDDLTKVQIGAIMIAIADEIDRRIPRPGA